MQSLDGIDGKAVYARPWVKYLVASNAEFMDALQERKLSAFDDIKQKYKRYYGRMADPVKCIKYLQTIKISVIIMDNAAFHSKTKIREVLEKAGHKLLCLPPYSPDLNPIEQSFAVIKS